VTGFTVVVTVVVTVDGAFVVSTYDAQPAGATRVRLHTNENGFLQLASFHSPLFFLDMSLPFINTQFSEPSLQEAPTGFMLSTDLPNVQG